MEKAKSFCLAGSREGVLLGMFRLTLDEADGEGREEELMNEDCLV